MICPVCRRAPSEAAHHPACGPHCWQGLDDMSPRAAIGSCAAVGVLLFAASLVLLGGCAGSTGACYVEAGYYGAFRLVAERPWAVDRTIGSFSTVADALDAAERIGCEVRP